MLRRKRKWRKILNDYKNGRCSERPIPSALKITVEQCRAKNGAQNLRSGFEKCLSRERVFDGKQLLETEPDGVVSKVLLNALQEKRFGGKLRTIQRKKLNVQPGKIIVDEDDENENEEEQIEEEDSTSEQEDPASEEEGPASEKEETASEEEIPVAERMEDDSVSEQDEISDNGTEGVDELEDFEESASGRWIVAFLMG